jgi:hypothetical protein
VRRIDRSGTRFAVADDTKMRCKNHNQIFEGRRTARNCVCVLATILIIACKLATTVGAQVSQPALTPTEDREARQLSIQFTQRLGETLDFSVVMQELFIRDAAARYVARQRELWPQVGKSDVTLSPGIFVDDALLEKATPDEWTELYGQANTFLLLGLIHASRKNANPDDINASDLYPPEIAKLLDTNPLLQNLIQKKTHIRTLKSPEDMRSAAATLQQANKGMRTSLPASVDLEQAVMRLVVRSLAGGRQLTAEELRAARTSLLEPHLEIPDASYFGFPKGTRMIWISSFAMMDLLLVPVDGKLRIVWAQPIDD